MKLKTKTNLITGLVVATPICAVLAGGSMLFRGDAATAVVDQVPPKTETVRDEVDGPATPNTTPGATVTRYDLRYDSVAEYF